MTTRSRDRVAPALVFLVALAVRGLYLWDGRDNPTFRLPILDAMTYDLAARSLARGEPLAGSFFWQPPFYPAFLTAVYWIGGSSIVFAKIVQALLGALTCLLTWRLGRKLFGAGVGLAAGLMAAVYGPLVFFDGELLAAGWAAFFSVALILLFLRAEEARTLPTLVVLGLCAALSVLTRPEFIPFLAGGGIWLCWRLRASLGSWRMLLRPAAAILVGFALPALPAAVANHHVTGHFGILPSSGAVNLYLGNNPRVDETVNARPGSEWSEIMDLPQSRGVMSPEMSARQRVYSKEVTDYLRTQPLEFAAGLGRKAVQLVSSREMPRNEDVYLYRKWSVLLGLLVWKAGPFGFPFGLVLPLAAVAFVLRPRRIPGLVWLYTGLFSLSIVLVFVTDRYRAPMMPVVLLAAALGGQSLVESVRRRRWPALGAGVGCMAATVLLATLPGPFAAERMNYEPEMYDGIGRTLGRYGRFPEAVEQLRKAVALNPDYADAHANLAYMLERAGRPPEAIEQYQVALERNPRMVHAYEGLGRLLASQGNPEEAIATYRRGLALRPYQASMRTSLGETLLSLGRAEEGMQECRRALEYDPVQSLALYLLGVEHAKRSEYAEAEAFLRRASRAAERGPRQVSVGDVYFALAKVSRLRKNQEQALECYAQAIRAYRRELDADPRNQGLKSSMGAVLEERRTYYGR